MFHKPQALLLATAFVITTCAVGAFLITRASTQAPAPITQIGSEQRSTGRSRNLSLRPEALRVSRKLGNRFASSRRDSSVLTGTLFTNKGQTSVVITRRQTDAGEAVEMALTNEPGALSWNQTDGATSSVKALSEEQRLLIERLVFDSADYFVLAQLRGASYQTVARNVRPDEAEFAGDYRGPLWDIVRIDDPERDVQKKPIGSWRLFYINSKTDLIDKIVFEQRGERMETILSDWTTIAGERVPARVTWKTGTQTLMELSLTTFTVAAQ